MRFGDGSAFLNHHFVKLVFLSSWKAIVAKSDWRTQVDMRGFPYPVDSGIYNIIIIYISNKLYPKIFDENEIERGG